MQTFFDEAIHKLLKFEEIKPKPLIILKLFQEGLCYCTSERFTFIILPTYNFINKTLAWKTVKIAFMNFWRFSSK